MLRVCLALPFLCLTSLSFAQDAPDLGVVSCPATWCDDGNPCTQDDCTLLVGGGHNCSNHFADALEGQNCEGAEWAEYCSGDGECGAAFSVGADNSCPSAWCNDGDDTTTDICALTDAWGGSECSYIGTMDSGDSGLDGTEVGPPGGPTVGIAACPASWCTDGNPCTMDTCSLGMDGSVECSSAFDESLEALTAQAPNGPSTAAATVCVAQRSV